MTAEFSERFRDVAQWLDMALISGHALTSSLKDPPPFGTLNPDGKWQPAPMQTGAAKYGQGPLFSLWLHIRDLEALRHAWTGRTTPTPVTTPIEPDKAPIDAQPRLSEG